jgi:hypothetical protein
VAAEGIGVENRLSELFPIQSIGPLIGGAILWFALNYLYIAPDLIGPRLAAKYYLPACMAAVQDGRQGHQNEVASLKQAFAKQQEELAQSLQQQMQQGVAGMFGMMLGGRPGSEAFFRQHGKTVEGWGNTVTAMGSPAIGERLRTEQRAFETQLAAREREAKKGIIYTAPAQFCGCVITEGMKERIDLAAFTATLRLYTPPAIRRFEDGTMLHEAKACGTPPVAA